MSDRDLNLHEFYELVGDIDPPWTTYVYEYISFRNYPDDKACVE